MHKCNQFSVGGAAVFGVDSSVGGGGYSGAGLLGVRWESGKHFVAGMVGVLHNAGGLRDEVRSVNVLQAE